MMTFEQAFASLLLREGGFVDDRNDPGGATKYGISKRSYPMVDIENLTIDQAKAIYLRDFWGPAGCDALPDAAKLQVFDMAVNSGVTTAIRTVQRATGATPDGVLGPLTLQAVQSMPVARFIARFNGGRLAYMAALPNWPSAGRGWANRIALNLMGT